MDTGDKNARARKTPKEILAELPSFVEKKLVKRLEDVPFEEILNGRAAFPLSSFESYLKTQMAEESLFFYSDVQDFKQEVEDRDLEKEAKVPIEKVKEIVDTYIKPAAELEVNIPGDMKEDTLEKVEKVVEGALPLTVDLFQEPEVEVKNLLFSDKYPGFIKTLKTTNLSDKLAAQAVWFGLSLLMIGMMISIAFIVLQYYVENDELDVEVLNSRYWRIIGFPFIMCGVMFIIAGRTRACTICSTLGYNHAVDDVAPSYPILIWKQMSYGMITAMRCRKQLPDELLASQTEVEIIRLENRRRGFRNLFRTMMVSMMMWAVFLFIPPNVPEWY